MLIEITIGNYKSIREAVTLSLVAAGIKELEKNNVFLFEKEKIKLLKSSVIYGPNAGGKSNFIEAIAFMRQFILSSHERSEEDEIPIKPFRLDGISQSNPSFFECIFVLDDIRYKYGFKILKTHIYEEYLYSYPAGRQRKLFERKEQNITTGSHFDKESKKFISHVRKNTLFLSMLAQLNIDLSLKLYNWFKYKLQIISGLDDQSYAGFTIHLLQQEAYKEKILKFLKIADLDINDIKLTKVAPSELLSKLPESKDKYMEEKLSQLKDNLTGLISKGNFMKLCSIHKKYNSREEKFIEEKFEFGEEESKGTQKLFNISGPVLETLKNGITIFIDELDARFHFDITKFIISLFNSDLNSSNAQLIFASHDLCLLDEKKMFRRDQIWFAEKDRSGATGLYSLVEFKRDKKKIRKDASYLKNYLLGNYGAVPVIDPDESKSLFN